jgi:hypothetical protein
MNTDVSLMSEIFSYLFYNLSKCSLLSGDFNFCVHSSIIPFAFTQIISVPFYFPSFITEILIIFYPAFSVE